MAEDFLDKIYDEAMLYTKLRELAGYARCSMHQKVVEELKAMLVDLEGVAKGYIDVNEKEGKEFWKLLKQLTDCVDDQIKLADLLEISIMPRLEKYLQKNACIYVDDEEGFCLESSRHGFLTMRDTDSNRYLHSAWDPMWEAEEQIKVLYDPKAEGYAVLGCGLGYHIYQLYRISDGSIKIHVFEKNERIVQYAIQYGVLSWIPQESLEVTIGEDLLPFLECAEHYDGACFVFEPEIDWMSGIQRELARSLYIGQCTRTSNDLQLHINFYRNIKSKATAIKNVDTSSLGEDFIVVAGGPSVDENMNFLRAHSDKMKIIAVGTIFRRLIQEKIPISFVTVFDSTKYTMRQLAGMEEETVPLLLATSAYWKWTSLYRGSIYLIPIASQLPEQEDYARDQGMELWNVGGSVTSLAVEAALRFGAKKIYLVGADFAYPDGVTHAIGTDRYEKRNVTDLIPVEGVAGGVVYTEASLDMYRRELENVIEQNPTVEFINMSKKGAKIRGTRRNDDV